MGKRGRKGEGGREREIRVKQPCTEELHNDSMEFKQKQLGDKNITMHTKYNALEPRI